MKTLTFYSCRIKHFVTIVFTFDKVHYIADDDTTYTIRRDECWHFNDDGLDRAKDYFEDPRFK